MIARQLSLDEALAAREAGLSQVMEHADASYRDKLYAAIQELGASGRDFCADDVRIIAGEPPAGQHFNLIGAVFNHAAKAGLIRTVGFTRSAQVRGHANTVRVYRGAA